MPQKSAAVPAPERNQRPIHRPDTDTDPARTLPAAPPQHPPRRSHAAAERIANEILAAMGQAGPPGAAPVAPSPVLRQSPEPSPGQSPGNAVRLSDIDPEPVHWLSPGRLALGKITVLDGDPGVGKSTLLCDLASRITRGEPLPGGQPAAPRSVILLAAEDGLVDTIRPRIDAAGGDPRRIVTLVSVPDRRSLVLDARHWLRAELADGPRPAKDMLREATERGLTRGALLAARKAEHVAVSKERVANGRWIWALPELAPEESGDAASSPHPDSSDSSDSSPR